MGSKGAVLLAALILSAPVFGQEYNPALIPQQMLGSPQTMTPLNLGDDRTALVSFGFEFPYFDQTFTSGWVSSNGFVSFDSANHLCCDGQQMTNAQRNTIYGYWTDLISSSNPYYSRGNGSILFGWYNTSEYGTNNKISFEIGLYEDGKIQFNYGALANTYHYVSGGVTGPTSSDNIQLFYGTNVQNVAFQSGVLAPVAPEPVVTVNCQATPDAPECDVIFSPEETSVVETATEPVIEQAVEVAPVAETASMTEAVVAVEELVQHGEVAQVVEAITEQPAAERLSPDELLALAAGSSELDRQEVAAASEEQAPSAEMQVMASVQSQQQFSSTDMPSVMQPMFSAQDSSQPVFQTVSASSDPSSPTSVQNLAQTLSIVPAAAAPSASAPVAADVASIAPGQNEAMAELTATPPGFTQYASARLPDAPFYKPRTIYRQKLEDANMTLYRMSRSNDQTYNAMVESQYGR